ncbi:sigma-70 family RNA polymerase sigma factor [Limibaculum sp. FT325]|uniref:sigma-70 family RNA polymerase sigma factor n=1 Tax=Thermohalobaculum sediminis TaxID=2939436 RepID=UPI0020BFD235|nr:sigma-70 family RNA polymerase sigma factor [Limibaculum sediminis]MCL5777522.1 sigma-70 family RNA polymerase sigma factor [Limibaculum sediminis]
MSDPFRDELVAALKPLRGFARTFHRDADRADDLVQETMVKAWANRDKFRPGTNMRAWLFTILRNSYYSELRKTRNEVEDADGALTERLTDLPAHDGRLAMRDFRTALATLGDDQREALILVGASGFSYEEAAEICGVAPGTIKSRVSRARARLAELLEGGDAEPGEDAPQDDGAPSEANGRGASADGPDGGEAALRARHATQPA